MNLCVNCSHQEHEHTEGLFGIVCTGLHWYESRQVDFCKCTCYVAPEAKGPAA